MILIASVSLADFDEGRGKEYIPDSKNITIHEYIKKGMQEVADSLIDPESARFRNVFYTFEKSAKYKYSLSVCGEINAKNRMGGYVGFKWFQFRTEYAHGYPVGKAVIFIDSSGGPFTNVAQSVCAEKEIYHLYE